MWGISVLWGILSVHKSMFSTVEITSVLWRIFNDDGIPTVVDFFVCTNFNSIQFSIYINITCYTFTRSVVINANSKKEEIKLNYDILNSMNEKEINEL